MVYHERQRLQQCGCHALNNLLQSKVFTGSKLDSLCYELTPWSAFHFNPHKSALGLGSYDVNVIEKALHSVGCELRWIKQTEDLTLVDWETHVGILLNVSGDSVLNGGRHWVALKFVNGTWYNLNSKLKAPLPFINRESFIRTLQHFQQDPTSHVFDVTVRRPPQDTPC
eukprot:RCo023850